MSEKIRLTAQAKSRLPEMDRQDAIRFCPKCGRKIPLDQSICAFCENTGFISHPRQSLKQKVLTIVLIVTVFLFLLIIALFLTRHTGI